MRKIIISLCPGIGTMAENGALVKPKRDIIYSAKSCGFEELIPLEDLYYNYLNDIDEKQWSLRLKRKLGRYFKERSNLKILKNYFENASPDDIVLFQYPLYGDAGPTLAHYIWNNIDQLKVSKKIILIHDLESFGREHTDTISKDEEIGFLKKFDDIIVHNHKMQDSLKSVTDKNRFWDLGIFDYIDNRTTDLPRNEKSKNTIFFAGNLLKSAFIGDLRDIHNYQFHIYGPYFNDGWKSENVVYHGSVDSQQILDEGAKYAYGLVWDGDRIDELGGVYGQYMKFNNPYKLSSNIVSGLPIITSKEAGISDFVSTYNIGLVVDSLKDLDTIQVSDSDYTIMKTNVLNLREKIMKGGNAKALIEQIINN